MQDTSVTAASSDGYSDIKYLMLLPAGGNTWSCCPDSRYYDGLLVGDDEMAQASCRDVVLAPTPADAPTGTMPLPKAVGTTAANAAAPGTSTGVLLSRAYSEDKLYTQVISWQPLQRLHLELVCAGARYLQTA